MNTDTDGYSKEKLTDKSLFREIYEEYRRPLEFYLKTYCQDIGRREELVQEVFIKIFRGLSSYDPAKPVKPYIYRIAGNTGVDWLRSRKFRESRNEDEFIDSSDTKYPGPELKLIRNEDEELVRKLIHRLKPVEQRLIHLYYYEGLKVREIAGIIGSPEGTVKYRLHRIRKKLALKLRNLEEGLR